MKLLLVILMMLHASIMIFATGQDEAALSNPAEQSIVAVTSNDYPPLSMVDPGSGESIGFEYDITNEIARRLGIQVEWHLSSWETMIAAVQNGEYDVGMDGITITEEREEVIDFSVPYLQSEQFMLVRSNEDRFDSPEDFSADPSLLVGAIAGTTNFYTAVYDVLDGDEANPRIILFNSFGALVQALISGDVDLVLMDAASSRGYIGVYPDKLAVVGESLGSEEFGYIFTPGSKFVDLFDQTLQEMKEDGSLDKLIRYWFFEYNFEN